MKKGWLIFLLVLSSIAGCAHRDMPAMPSTDKVALEKAISGDSLGVTWTEATLPDYPLFVLSPEMKAFASRAVAGHKTPFLRAQALHAALIKSKSAGGAGLRYEGYVTGTPAEAFENGDVNCVSFTLLYVTMARYVGLRAAVNEVDLPLTWDMRNNNTFLLLRHVNTKVQLGRGDVLVVDLEMSRYNPSYEQRIITDELAAAQFYNNRAMEEVARENLNAGFLYLRKALLLEDKESYIWNNLGTLLRRANLNHEAEAVYLHGLSLGKWDMTIVNNLNILYQHTGRVEEAKNYARMAENYHRHNPFFHYSLALAFTENGDLMLARDSILTAIKMRKNEPLFYELAAAIFRALDERDQADRMQAKSLEIRSI